MGNSNSGSGPVQNATSTIKIETSNLSTQVVIWAIVGFIVFELICIFCLIRYCCCRAHSMRRKHYKEREIIIKEDISATTKQENLDSSSEVVKSEADTQARSEGLFEENRRIAEKILKTDDRSIKTKSDVIDENDREINFIYSYDGSLYELPISKSKQSSLHNFKLNSRLNNDNLDNLDKFELSDNISPRQPSTLTAGSFNPYDQYDTRMRYSRQQRDDNQWEIAREMITVDWERLKEETSLGNGFRYAVVNETEFDEVIREREIDDDYRFIKGRIFGKKSQLIDKAVNCRLSPTSFVESEIGLSRIGHEARPHSGVSRDNDWILNLDSTSNSERQGEFVTKINISTTPSTPVEDFRQEENISYENFLTQASKSDLLGSYNEMKLSLPPLMLSPENNQQTSNASNKNSLRSILKKRETSTSEASSRPSSSSLNVSNSLNNKINDSSKGLSTTVASNEESSSTQQKSVNNLYQNEFISKLNSSNVKKSLSNRSQGSSEFLSEIKHFKIDDLRSPVSTTETPKEFKNEKISHF